MAFNKANQKKRKNFMELVLVVYERTRELLPLQIGL